MKFNMKIITVCGSLKFQKEMMKITEFMNKQGNCMLTPVYSIDNNVDYTDKEKEIAGLMHFERIKLADAILVINVDGYIGDSTKKEIDFAKSLNKEIIYYTDLM